MNLNQAINHFIDDVCVGKTNLTTLAYKNKLSYLSRYIGSDMPMSNFTPQLLIDFRKDMQSRNTKQCGSRTIVGKLSPFTVATAFVTVRYFFVWCHKNNITSENLMEGIDLPKAPKPDPKAVRNDTVLELLKLAAETGEAWCRPRNIAIVYLLRDTGGRLNALSKIDVDNMELNLRRIQTTTKGDKHVTLRLTNITVQAIKNWLPIRASLAPLDHKLLTNKRGVGLAPLGIYRAIYTLAERGQITGRSNPHAFRHAFARDLLRNGADLSTVSQLMNHSSIQVTADYYARWSDDELQYSHNKYSPANSLPLITPRD